MKIKLPAYTFLITFQGNEECARAFQSHFSVPFEFGKSEIASWEIDECPVSEREDAMLEALRQEVSNAMAFVPATSGFSVTASLYLGWLVCTFQCTERGLFEGFPDLSKSDWDVHLGTA